MKKLGAKLDKFNQGVKATIETLLETKGVVSRFDSRLVLIIRDENAMFNLASDRYLVEISKNELFDNEGYIYSFDSLNLENLCIAIDSVIDGIVPTFQLVTMDEDGDDVIEYFQDKQEGYKEFVKIQCKDKEVRLKERKKEIDRYGIPIYKTINEHLIDFEG